MQDADEADVEAHVAVEDVAELVGHDTLKLVARQQLRGAARDADDGVLRLVARREGVDAPLAVEQVDRGDGHAGGDRHLLHDVEDLPLGVVAGAQVQEAAAEGLRHDPAAGRQLADLDQAGGADERHCAADDPEQQLRRPEVRRRGAGLAGGREDEQHHDRDVDECDDAEKREAVENDELPRPLAGLLLMLEEVHAQMEW